MGQKDWSAMKNRVEWTENQGQHLYKMLQYCQMTVFVKLDENYQ